MSESKQVPEYGILKAYLDADDWRYEEVPGKAAFRANEDTELCTLTYYFQLFEGHHQFGFYIVPNLEIGPELLDAVVEYTTRVNCGLRIGNFEVCHDVPNVSFKSSFCYDGINLTPELLNAAVQPAISAFTEFFPGLATVMTGVLTPEQALDELKSSGSGE